MDDEIPMVAIGYDEMKEGSEKRRKELLDKIKSNKSNKLEEGSDSLKFITLMLSRGKTEEGELLKCDECGKDFIWFEGQSNLCTCGNQLRGDD